MALQSITALASITLQSASSVTFSGIPGNYRDLILVVNGISTTNANLDIRFNGDTGINYPEVLISHDGNTLYREFDANRSFLRLDYNGFIGTAPGHINVVQIMDYSQTNKHKTVLARASNGTLGGVAAVAGRYTSTNAINSISIFQSGLTTGSTINLYGRIA
jgi:hypothetical protein